MLTYFGAAAVPQGALNDDQFRRLQEYRSQLQTRALCGSFDSVDDLKEQALLHLTSVVAELLQKDRGQPSPADVSSKVLTAPTPDVRVEVSASLVYFGGELEKFIAIAVQNHSPMTVFIASISIALKDGSKMFFPRDGVTGEHNRRHVLQPGEGYQFHVSPSDILQKITVDDLLYAYAKDDIGREYRCEEGAVRRSITQLGE